MPCNLDNMYLCFFRAIDPGWFPSVPVCILLSNYIPFFSSSAPKRIDVRDDAPVL
jgi:hypothetical protein